ncbi:MAG: Glu-tRNAGln amidotransferase subunit [Pseudomonadota bacterium]|jgi:aspartyl-tRNA(Asn)/glutamyl-tRNA(Gln) amidotransferase subunit C
MTVHVDQALLQHVAKLARIEVASEQAAATTAAFAAMVAMAERLADVEVGDLEPMQHPDHPYPDARADEAGAVLPPQALEANAPRFGAGGFVVPRVVE